MRAARYEETGSSLEVLRVLMSPYNYCRVSIDLAATSQLGSGINPRAPPSFAEAKRRRPAVRACRTPLWQQA
jgi:hypothetical protein